MIKCEHGRPLSVRCRKCQDELKEISEDRDLWRANFVVVLTAMIREYMHVCKKAGVDPSGSEAYTVAVDMIR